MKVKIKDINDLVGFFTTFKTEKLTHFENLLGELTDEETYVLDELLTDLQGERILNSRYSDIFDKKGADVTMKRCLDVSIAWRYDKWLVYKQALAQSYSSNVDKPLNETKEYEETREGNASDNRQDKTNAFDSVTASNTDSSNSETEHEETILHTENISKSNGKTIIDNSIEKIDFIQNNDLITYIIKDVGDIMGLYVY